MFKHFTFILIYLFYSTNASDLFQKIDHLEIYSPDYVIFNDEPPVRIQLKAFDSNGNKLNLDSVQVEWSFKGKKLIQGTVKTHKIILIFLKFLVLYPELQIIPFNDSTSFYQSTEDINLLEQQGLHGSAILIKPIKYGIVIGEAQIKDPFSDNVIFSFQILLKLCILLDIPS